MSEAASGAIHPVQLMPRKQIDREQLELWQKKSAGKIMGEPLVIT